jgi:predicted RNA-binding protein with PUA-like domain
MPSPTQANHWLVKTEPGDYSFDDLVRDGTTTWTGVANAVAQKHLKAMAPGDRVFVYHTGDVKAIVGLAKVASEPRPDKKEPKFAVVDLTADRPVKKPVTLAAVKADPEFADFSLVRIGRLSVMPVPETLWKRLLKMAGEGVA